MSTKTEKPSRYLGVWRACVGLLLVAMAISPIYSALAAQPANSSFTRTWERPDKAVSEGRVSRTWMWGPEAFTPAMNETYAEAPGGERLIQYYDKSRMEITDPNADPATDWYVTNGLLVVELITGDMQVGDNQFEERNPAAVNVAGDATDPNGPTYESFRSVLDAAARSEGSAITERIARDGSVSDDSSLLTQGVAAGHYVGATDHTVADPFWAFMNSQGLVYQNGQYQNGTLFPSAFYATGLPITEAYWAEVEVGGDAKDVLIQCFERRCLTYTPANPAGWQVEAGNVGQHYYDWRYDGGSDGDWGGDDPDQPTPDNYRYVDAWDTQAIDDPLLDAPVGIAVGPSGDLYIAASAQDRIQRFTSEGIHVTSWGQLGADPGDFDRPEGVATDANGNVYVADFNNDHVQIFDEYGIYKDNIIGAGPADENLDGPMDVAIDTTRDYLYVVENKTHRVQRFKLSNGNARIILAGQGSGDGQLYFPNGIGVDAQGNIYVADTANHRIQKFDFDGEFIASFGSQGKGDNELTYPRDVHVDADGRVYVVNSGDQNGGASIRVWEPSNEEGTEYSFVYAWGETGPDPGQFDYPARIAMDEFGYFYVTELRNDRVQKFTADGELVDYWGDASRNAFGRPFGIDRGDDGYLYVVDDELPQIKVFAEDGSYVHQWSDQLVKPVDVTVSNGYAYVVEQSSNAISKYSTSGEFIASWGSYGSADGEFDKPSSIDVDEYGFVYIVDSGNYRVQKFTADGEFVLSWGSYGTAPGQFEGGKGIAVHDGAVYVVEFFPARLQKFDLEGNYITEWGGEGEEPGQFDGAYAVSVDEDGYVYVADRDNHRVQKFTADGEFVAMITPETAAMPAFSYPLDVAVGEEGKLFVVSDLLDGIMIFEPEAAN